MCPHEQLMFGVLFTGSHCVLQYCSRLSLTNKRGVTIFSAFAPAISFLLASDQRRVIHNDMLDTGEKHFCSITNTFHLDHRVAAISVRASPGGMTLAGGVLYS